MKRNTIFPMIGIAAGLLAIIFAIVAFTSGGSSLSGSTGTYTSYAYYGGDAYTGIQQAAADTARNVKNLAEIVQSGFRSVGGGNNAGFILLVMGFALIAFSGAKLSEYKASALYEQAVLNALKAQKTPEQAPTAEQAPAAPANRWHMDTAWPVADPQEVSKKAEAIVAEPPHEVEPEAGAAAPAEDPKAENDPEPAAEADHAPAGEEE